MNWLLRGLVVLGQRSRLARAGFILPTVTMVMLVVILLTTAIVFRSFDRAKNASNYRVNQAVLNAAQPAIDRAKRKLDELFASPNTRGTPGESVLNQNLKPGLASDKYTFQDETRLNLSFDISGNGNIDTPTFLLGNETTNNAWRFPVDTDNNGEFDSFTLYSILFRSPTRDGDSKFDRQRNPLEARTTPMDDGSVGDVCAGAQGTSASLVGGTDWYQSGGRLKKPFFIYVATVPITNKNQPGLIPPTEDIDDYEDYAGQNQGFSALEYQQDRSVIPPSNNAVVYQDDLDIFSGPAFRLNGRIFTNSNLFVSKQKTGDPINLYQVSSPESCYYQPENGKIIVGGNLGYSDITTTAAGSGNVSTEDGSVVAHLFKENTAPTQTGQNVNISSANKSVKQVSADLAYNTQAYERRITFLVDEGLTKNDPDEVEGKKEELVADGVEADEARRQAMELYFRNRTRHVPFSEVAIDDPLEDFAGKSVQGDGNTLRPPDEWMYPFKVEANGATDVLLASSNTGLELNTASRGSSKLLLPKATNPESVENGNEAFIGDRVLIGNNLPANWYLGGDFVGQDQPQPIKDTQWDAPAGQGPRTRQTRVEPLKELDITNRDGFWERNAAEVPDDPLEGVGGLRVVTGAGVYLPHDDNIAAGSTVVWPDTMPVIPPTNAAADPPEWDAAPQWLPNGFPVDAHGDERPFLKMRATAVYFYGTSQPIACVSTFYDPTNRDTARNVENFAGQDLGNDDDFDVSGILANGNYRNAGYETPNIQGTPGISALERQNSRQVAPNSLNGITYAPFAAVSPDPDLNYQANLFYPNGRRVNQLLRDAMDTPAADRSLAQQAAIDSASCGLQILDGNLAPDDAVIPHGAIQEVAFLDGRQIKSIEATYNPEVDFDPDAAITPDNPINRQGVTTLANSNYDLPLEQRQPLEIRATAIDLGMLRTTPRGAGEFLLPNSGIIYATREDALPDQTALPDEVTFTLKSSARDFRLDPTRRPNGILLVNGQRLDRRTTYAAEEKGLILASDLPVYVQGNFNLHQSGGNRVEEFKNGTQDDRLDSDWSDFYARKTENLDDNFACRQDDPRLPTGSCGVGDQWRPATIVSDAVTLLSDGFRFGFRNEGDYDLRNNQIDNITNPNNAAPVNDIASAQDIENARLRNGFFDNNFVTSGLSSGGFSFLKDSIRTGFPSVNLNPLQGNVYSKVSPPNPDAINSSYFNNFITPIQRRANTPEYLMEVCVRLPVSDCGPNDWFVNPGAGTRASALITTPPAATTVFNIADHRAGTTARPPEDTALRRFPRRVAFARITAAGATQDDLILHNNLPIPLGIGAGNVINCYSYGTGGAVNGRACVNYNATRPSLVANNLWFRTTDDAAGANPYDPANSVYVNDRRLFFADEQVLGAGNRAGQDAATNADGVDRRKAQPLLVPTLQLQVTTQGPGSGGLLALRNNSELVAKTQWLSRASGDTTFNMVMATGDNPSRPQSAAFDADLNGGLANLPHFLENWATPADDKVKFATNITGSFIQLKRSEYATAPWWSTRPNLAVPALGGLFGDPQMYTTGESAYAARPNIGKLPYFIAPKRQWGFDVGLLSQSPDLFSQQFSLSFVDDPNEFFREVSRDDDWVRTLLCAKTVNGNKNAINRDAQLQKFCDAKTGG
ncbi:MAG TPA: hypothetical protein DCY91_25375 [Cyanobacteria bacterium UBA11370]|nr:hypothetical protein [Cyanobacteria bacterium UBA11370]